MGKNPESYLSVIHQVQNHCSQKPDYFHGGSVLFQNGNEHNHIFETAKNAVIRYIALDIGGVFFDGELYADFFQKIESLYHIKIPRIKNDKLNIDMRMMKGEITIVRYISEKTGRKFSDREAAHIFPCGTMSGIPIRTF